MTIKKEDRGYIASKIVYVRRRKIHNPRGEDETTAIKKIGASRHANGPLRGLSPHEEAAYFPEILGIQPSDPDWSKTTREYWNNIAKPVEAGAGLKLEVGFLYKTKKGAEQDAKGDVGVNSTDPGYPANVSDYVLYRFCKKHPKVANTIDDVDKSQRIWFYLYSKQEQLAKETTKLNTKDTAMQLYVKQLGNLDLMRQVLWISGDNPLNQTDQEVRLAFEVLAQDAPSKFIGIVSDKNLGMKVFIEKALQAGHLNKIDNTDTFYYGETHNVIGSGVNDVVAFFKTGSTESKRLLNDLQVKLKVQDVLTAPASLREEKVVNETGKGSITGTKSEKESNKVVVN